MVHPTRSACGVLTAMAGVVSVGSNWVRRSSINPAQIVITANRTISQLKMLIARLRRLHQRQRCGDRMRQTTTAEVRHNEGKAPSFMRYEAGTYRFRCPRHPSRLGLFAMDAQKPDNGTRPSAIRAKTFS